MTARTIRDTLEGQRLVTAQSTMTVTEVAAMMKADEMGAILVLSDTALVGIFTERDALFRVAAEGLDPNQTAIAEVMTPNPTTIGPDKPFTDALELMHGGQYRHVPVVENGGPIGMVSSRDAMGPELEQFMYSKILQEQAFDVLAWANYAMDEIEVLVPIAETRIVERSLAPRLPQLKGARIGWLDNMKANAPELLRELAVVLRDRGADGEMVFASKNATAAAPESVVAHLRTCDAVVLAISDWGSCTSWSVHDSIVLEEAGIPTAVVCSDEFGPLARAESQVLGQRALPLIPIPHPLAGNDGELVEAKARAIADEVASALTDPVAALQTRYESRFLGLTERRLDGGAVCVDEVCAIDPAVTRIQAWHIVRRHHE